MEEGQVISSPLEPTVCEVDDKSVRLVLNPRTKTIIWQYFTDSPTATLYFT